MKSRIGQILLIGVPGPELTDAIRRSIERIQPGGFILFHRNLASPEQVFNLIKELREICGEDTIFTLDQEGGRVSRLKMIGEEPPSASDLQKAGKIEWCREHGILTGKVMRALGFNLNLAPVVDFAPQDDADNSLRGRCYGKTPEEAIRNANAFLEGMQSEGVLGTAKHFPGYTFCEKDPHGDLPLITRTQEQMRDEELKAFRFFADKADAMMIGHGHFTAWHKESVPASLSPVIIQKLLREEIGFNELIMTDDIEMGAIANQYNSAETTRLAIEAGNDMVLICHNPACVELAFDALNAMPAKKLEKPLRSIANFKKKLPAPSLTFVFSHWQTINDQISEFKNRVRR
ncbi:MAG: glycoside hydrolase family 3 N-terminal domain-containing protein [Verrucomicrobiota bacterium]